MKGQEGRLGIREIKALEMLHDGHRVAETSTPGEYIVVSQSGNGLYRVNGVGVSGAIETCTCPDFVERNSSCKHIFATHLWLTASAAPPQPPDVPIFDVPPPRKAPVNWGAYSEAQADEHRLFHVLLRDLVIGFPEPVKDPHRAGRKPIPLWAQVFCAVQKSYLGFSLRRSHGFRDQAARNGLLDKTPFWSVPSRFLCREDVTEGLHEMLARSAYPLIGLEDRCAVDSTGLRTTRFHSYRHEKYEPSRKNIWVKMHALVGVRTHAIPVLQVTEGVANDSPQFPPLLKRATSYGFQFKEVYADKGYQSRENFNVASELDVVPFIPFKRNQTGQTKGSPMYHKMFLFFQYHRDEFDQHYGQRAQVESSFGAFKAKFGETLASKNIRAQINETLCRAIAYNITILVRQMYEAGILPDFLNPPTSAQVAKGASMSVASVLSLNREVAPVPVTELTRDR